LCFPVLVVTRGGGDEFDIIWKNNGQTRSFFDFEGK
jgi:hypothetical protein